MELFSGRRDDLRQLHNQTSHRVYIRIFSDLGAFPSKIIHSHGAAQPPSPESELLDGESLRLCLATYLTEHLLEDILESDKAGGPSEFIQDDRQPPLLSLQRLEQSQEIHRL